MLCVFPALAGCALPYAYPRLDATKPVRLANSMDGVTAFRVEYTAVGNPKWDRQASEYDIRTLSVDPGTSEIPQQARIGIERGLFLYMVHLAHDLKLDQGVEVRLYKRGYRSAQIARGYQGGALELLAAKNVTERENAIDMMFGPDVAGSSSMLTPDDVPIIQEADDLFAFEQTGSASYKSACQFGIDEYAWMEKDAQLGDLPKARIEKKRQALEVAMNAPLRIIPKTIVPTTIIPPGVIPPILP